MVNGQVKVGEEFEWCAYGSEGWPHAWAYVTITAIRSFGESMPFTEDDDDSDEAECEVELEDRRTKKRYWNTLRHFRDMATRAKK